jgi:type II secretory pathway component PulF
MPLFRFKILTSAGSIESGVLDLPVTDPEAAVRYVETTGGIALEIQPLPRAVDAFIRRTGLGIGKISRLELSEFYNNLGMLVGAGVTVMEALEELSIDTKNPRLKNAITCIRADIQSGQTVSESLARQAQIAPFVVRHMVQIGEETGQLDAMLHKSGAHLRHIHDIVSGTKRALTYPAFLLVVVTLAVVFWFWYVVPQLVMLFQDMGVELPAPTRLLMAMADWFQNWFLTSLGVLAVLGGVLAWARKRFLAVRYALSMLALRVPVLSLILHTSLTARATEYLGITIGAGIGVLRSLSLVIESTGNEVYKARLQGTRKSIMAGLILSDALRQNQALDPFAVRMLAVGEMTGKLDEQAQYVAELYRQKLAGLVEVLSKTLEPMIMIFLGGMFALIMVGLLMPVYELVTKLGA